MAKKTQFVQIRVSRREKESLKRYAAAAGQDLSGYILSRALPPGRERLEELLRSLLEDADHRFVLAELNDFLSALAPAEFAEAVEGAEVPTLPPYLANYVAAMVEQAAHQKGAEAPAWVGRVTPLDTPHFATPLESLRLHLLRASPVPFKRRNIFVDSGVADRV